MTLNIAVNKPLYCSEKPKANCAHEVKFHNIISPSSHVSPPVLILQENHTRTGFLSSLLYFPSSPTESLLRKAMCLFLGTPPLP